MNAPARADVEQLLRRARENLDLADAASDDAERSGRYRQAAQALSSAGRIVAGLADATAPPPGPGAWGLPLAYGGAAPARGVLAGPAPR
jgi:hypothetical protein